MPSQLVLQSGIFLSVVVVVLWKYFRQLVLSSPLDNIPGPPANSLIYGAFQRSTFVSHRLLLLTKNAARESQAAARQERLELSSRPNGQLSRNRKTHGSSWGLCFAPMTVL